jgi:hypothetical protein
MGGAVSVVPLSALNTCTFVASLALIWFLPVLPCTVMSAVSRLLHCILLEQNQLLEFGNLSYLPFGSYALSPSVQINIKINK